MKPEMTRSPLFRSFVSASVLAFMLSVSASPAYSSGQDDGAHFRQDAYAQMDRRDDRHGHHDPRDDDRGRSQTVGDVRFTFDSIERQGGDVVVTFTIVNIGRSPDSFWLYGNGHGRDKVSTLTASGYEYKARSVEVSGERKEDGLSRRYDPGAPLHGMVRFNDIPRNVRAIDLIRIAFSGISGSSGAFQAQSVPLR